MPVPGVGPKVALSIIVTVDRAERFIRCADIGAFLDVPAKRYQSGETDWSGRISKCSETKARRDPAHHLGGRHRVPMDKGGYHLSV